VRLADDERARVPFALIGVLLLVSSVAIATVQLDQERIDRDAALAGDRAEAAAETVLRDAVRGAGERAAANPVVSPADSEYGEVLDPERLYRSYLELLIAIELRERLGGTPQRVGDATGTVELPPIEDPESARAAVESVSVEPNGRGVVEATISELPIVIRREGTVVGERPRTLTVHVTTPTLTLHERTSTFQSRLNADSLKPGTLNRGLTGSLWSLAWTRGYAQYAGVPFENVVDNGHIELVTNLAVLDVQRSVFGHSDRQAERRLADETATVVANEGMGMASGAFEDAALPMNASTPIGAPEVESPDPEPREIGVDRTADLALADLLEPRAEPESEIVTEADTAARVVTGGIGSDTEIVEGPDPWEFPETAIVRTAASIDVQLRTETRSHDPRRIERDPVPEPTWTRERTIGREELSPTVQPGSAPLPSVGGDWSVHREAERTVTLRWTETVRYRNETGGSVHSIDETYEQRVDVGIALLDRPVQREWIPDAGFPSSGGELYESLRERATGRLFADQGGVDGVSESIAEGESVETETVVAPADSDPLATTAYEDGAGLREELRGVSTTASTGHALTNDERPVAELADGIRDESATYRSVPASYDGLQHRSTVTLRSLYLDRVLTRLDARAEGSSNARADVSDKVSGMTELAGASLSDFFQAGMDYSRPESADLSARDPAPNLTVTVDADPSYLDTEAVETSAPTPTGDTEYHPMGARTTTIGSLPTEEVTSGITGAIVSAFADEKDKVPLSVAARTLGSAKDARSADVETELSDRDVEKLHKDVGDEVDEFVPELAEPLAAETALEDDEAEDLVTQAFHEYGGTDGMDRRDRFEYGGAPAEVVIAAEDGALTTRIADLAAKRSDVSAVDADRARTRMRAAREAYLAKDDSQVTVGTVESVGEPTRKALEKAVGSAVEKANERGVEATTERIITRTGFSVLPSRGFPLAPVPSWWYVTANVWHVEVHGTYARFVVRADQGGPSGGGQVSYVRDGQPVHVDVDGDGAPERLGTSDRVRFFATSTVAVAVPRGGGGIGNNATGFRATTEGWDPARGAANACGAPRGLGGTIDVHVCREDGRDRIGRDWIDRDGQ